MEETSTEGSYRDLAQLTFALAKLLEWLGSDGFKVDVDLCKKLHPKIRSFEVWLRSESTFTG